MIREILPVNAMRKSLMVAKLEDSAKFMYSDAKPADVPSGTHIEHHLRTSFGLAKRHPWILAHS